MSDKKSKSKRRKDIDKKSIDQSREVGVPPEYDSKNYKRPGKYDPSKDKI